MILGVEGVRWQGISASGILSGTGFIGLHILGVPDLGSSVRVVVEAKRRHVRNQISIMHHSVDWELASKVCCEGRVAYARLTIRIELVDLSKCGFNIECGDRRESSAKTVSSDVNGSSPVLVEDDLNLCLNSSRHF